ncbi:CBFB_NFYA domain-containing protein [Cephalotus follicularis]|uniref:Nuclear transcription factor Y subunit n=1 Tax=Cephalotus follicularis TaxID=3775 RepID=A0A1Q3AMZ4_CEPFO|nr:CBFB_NFYA domain-containing protein [Cephalotus follicularis]
MQSKPGSANQIEPDPHAIPPSVYTEPWWRNVNYSATSSAVTRGNTSNSSSLEVPNGSESNDGQSHSDDELNEDNEDATKEPQTTTSQPGNCGQENQNLQHVMLTMPAMRNECLTQPPQLELVGHSIECASNPYQDPYYGGMMSYGHQPLPLGYPPFGTPHARMALPLEMAQEPVYVNAKQYQGILRRRQARAKAELERRLIKVRRPYLHESRHQHAMRRARGTGGRFAKKIDDASKSTTEKMGTGSGQALSSQSASSSGSEHLPSDSAETWNSSISQQEARESQVHDTQEAHNYINGSALYPNHSGMPWEDERRLFRTTAEEHLFKPGFTEASCH